MKKRATATVKGNVQESGFRNRVRQTAWDLGITGNVENLDTGEVKIIAEGEEDLLKEFLESINIKNELIFVKHIAVDFSEPTGEFTGFKKIIKEDEIGDRMDTFVECLKLLIKTVKDGNKELGDKIDNLGKDLGNKIDNGFGKMDGNFKHLDTKYDRVSDKMDSIDNTLKELTKAILKLAGEKPAPDRKKKLWHKKLNLI